MSEIRSVSVHLDADVAGYIAKMRLAGAETDKAFSSSSRSIDTTNRSLSTTESRLAGVDSKAKTVDTSLRRVESTFSRMGNNRSGIATVAGKLDHFIGGLGAIPSLALAAGPALIPLTAAVVGLGAALAAPIAFAGGGLTLFGLLGGAAIKQTEKEFKNVDTLGKAVQSARTSLEQARRSAGANASTSASVANAQENLTKATVAYHDALKAISPQQREFHDALETLDSDFAKFIRGPAGQDLLGPFTQGLQVADNLLPHVQPVIHAVAGSLDDILGEFDRAAQSPGFDRFMHAFAGQAGHDIKAFGHIIGDITPGLGHLFLILDRRLSPEVLHEVDHLAQGFSDWAKSKGARQDVKSFIAYLHETGPDVAHAVEAIARGTAHLVRALAPLGPPALHVITGIADALSSVPTGVLTDLAKAGAGLVVFQKLGGFKLLQFAHGGPGGGLGIPGLGGGGGLPGVGRGVVPVYVTNPGFGGPGGRTPVPVGSPGVPKGTGGIGGAASAAEEEAVRAAKLAADAARARGAGLVGESTAAAKAFKEAMAAHDVAVIKEAVSFGGTSGLRGILRGVLSAPASITLGAAGAEVGKNPITQPGLPNNATPRQTIRFLIQFATPAQRRDISQAFGEIGPGFKSTGTAVDALHAKLARASRDMDLVGHSAHQAFDGAGGDVRRLSSRLATIKGGPASAQMDLIGHSAHKSLGSAGGDVDRFQHKVSGLHGPKPLRVDADTSSADHKIKATDRSLTVLSQHRATPTVTADTGQAEAALRRVYADLAAIRSKTITLTTVHATGGRSVGNAEGGPIFGPGGPKSDSILARVSNGEYVVRAAAVQHYGLGFMDAVNAKAFADGGLASTTHVTRTVGGQPVDPIARHLNDELHKMRQNLADVNKELQAEQQHRQNLVQAEKQLESTVASNFRSQIFGVTPDGGIWGPGATSDPLRILRGDIRDARTYRRDIGRLRHRGLRGGALAEVTTLADAEQALGLPKGELRDISREYQIRQRASQAAGAALGDLRYGAQLAQANHHLKELRGDVHRLQAEVHHQTVEQHKHAKTTGDAVAKGVNDGVRSGVRRGSKP